jgi:hypothetical protein
MLTIMKIKLWWSTIKMTIAAGDQFPLPPSVASVANDHPLGRVIFFFGGWLDG